MSVRELVREKERATVLESQRERERFRMAVIFSYLADTTDH